MRKNRLLRRCFGVWQMPQRDSKKRGKLFRQAQDGLERRNEQEIVMDRSKSHQDPFSSDQSFPYVLLCSMVGTIVSLAFVWIIAAQSVAQAMVA
jgi:hypothetical protein